MTIRRLTAIIVPALLADQCLAARFAKTAALRFDRRSKTMPRRKDTTSACASHYRHDAARNRDEHSVAFSRHCRIAASCGILEIQVFAHEGIPTATSGRGTIAVVAPHRDGYVVGVKPCDPNRRILVRRLETSSGPMFISELVT